MHRKDSTAIGLRSWGVMTYRYLCLGSWSEHPPPFLFMVAEFVQVIPDLIPVPCWWFCGVLPLGTKTQDQPFRNPHWLLLIPPLSRMSAAAPFLALAQCSSQQWLTSQEKPARSLGTTSMHDFAHFGPSSSLPTPGARTSERAAVWCSAAHWGSATAVLLGSQRGARRI